MAEGMVPITMVSADGRVVAFEWHPSLVGLNRADYEKRGWRLYVEPEPRRRGPRPKEAEPEE